MSIYTYEVKTNHPIELINIDKLLDETIEKSKIVDGIAIVFVPHTTAGVTINENGDPDVKKDLAYALNILSPKREEYIHFEGNSHAHLLSTLIGASENIIIHNRKAILGVWQSIYFCEADGPRTRKIHIKIIKG